MALKNPKAAGAKSTDVIATPNPMPTTGDPADAPVDTSSPDPAIGGGVGAGPVIEGEAEGGAEMAADKDEARKAPKGEADSSAKEDASLKAKIAKAAGVKVDDVIGFSAYNQTIVTAAGGKYKLAADGKGILHLAGPIAPSQVEG